MNYCRCVGRRQLSRPVGDTGNHTTSANRSPPVSRQSPLPLPNAGDFLQRFNVKDCYSAVTQFHQALPLEIP